MADSDPLISTVRRYQTGTDKIKQWLRKSVPTSSSPAEPLATEARGESANETLSLARAIAGSSNPTIDIPLAILHRFEDVITDRQECARFFRRLAAILKSAAMKASNDSHQHFIEVLIEAFRHLKAEYQRRQPKVNADVKSPDPNATKKPVNLFQMLEIEDTAQNAAIQGTPMLSKAQSDKTDQAEVHATRCVDDDGFEKRLAIWALLRDAHDVRKSMQQAWSRLATEEFWLLTAMRNFESHIAVINAVARQLTEAFSDLVDYSSLLAALDLSGFPSTGGHQSGGEATCKETAEEMLCFDAYFALFHFMDLHCYYWCKKGKPPYRVPLHTEVPYPRHPFSTGRLAVFRDMQDLLPRYNGGRGKQNLSTLKSAYGNVDEYTFALLHLANTGYIKIETVLVTQMYMDMYDHFDGKMDIGRSRAEKVAKFATRALDDYRQRYERADEYVKAHVIDPESKLFQSLQLIHHDEDHHGKDGWRIRNSSTPDKLTFLPWDLLNGLPLLPMLLAVKQLQALQAFGAISFNKGQGFLGMAHMYRAVKDHGGLTKFWPDMEILLTSNQESDQLVRTSSDLRSFAKQYSSSLGLPCSSVSDREPGLLDPKYCSGHAKDFKAKMYMQHGSLEESQNQSILEERNCGLDLHYAGLKEYLKQGGSFENDQAAQQFHKFNVLEPKQLLGEVAHILTEEEPHLLFDHLGFFSSYLELFDQLKTKHYRKLSSRLPAREEGYHAYELIHSMFWEAILCQEKIGSLKDTTLFEVSKLLVDLIKRAGSDYSLDPLLAELAENEDVEDYVEDYDDHSEQIQIVLWAAHLNHAHSDIDLLLGSPQRYQDAVKKGVPPAQAAEQEVKYVTERSVHTIPPELIHAQRDKALTTKLMRMVKQISYDNGDANGSKVAPHIVEEVLKTVVPYMSQHSGLMSFEGYEREMVEQLVENEERKRRVWTG